MSKIANLFAFRQKDNVVTIEKPKEPEHKPRARFLKMPEYTALEKKRRAAQFKGGEPLTAEERQNLHITRLAIMRGR